MSRIKPNLFLSIILCLLAGIIGSVFTFSAIPIWYTGLSKPWFSPPNWIFGPVWTTLYVMMGVSFYLVWKTGTKKKGVPYALKLFLIQLGLNALWSILFFGLKNPWLAFSEILVLWTAIYLTINSFKKISPIAALLLIPYLFWVTFALLLNYSIAFIN